MNVAPWLVLVTLTAGPTARLEYVVQPGLEGCPDERWVRTAVAGRLGRDPFSSEAPTVVRVRIDRNASGLGALVEVQRTNGTAGRRTLNSPAGDCMELASSVELAITLAIEPLWLTGPRSPASPVAAPTASPAPPEPQAAPAPVEVAPPRPPPPREREETPVAVSGQASLYGTAGGTPGATVGLALGGFLRRGPLALGLEGRVSVPSGLEYAFGSVSTFQALGAVLPCLATDRLRFCGVVALGPFQVESSGSEVRRATTLMAQTGLRVDITVHLTERLSLQPWAEAMVVLTRTSVISGSNTLWVSWPVSLSAGVAVAWRFSS